MIQKLSFNKNNIFFKYPILTLVSRASILDRRSVFCVDIPQKLKAANPSNSMPTSTKVFDFKWTFLILSLNWVLLPIAFRFFYSAKMISLPPLLLLSKFFWSTCQDYKGPLLFFTARRFALPSALNLLSLVMIQQLDKTHTFSYFLY